MNFSSKLLENAVNEFSALPGIGQKTALRLVLHLLNRPNAEVEKFSNALTILKRDIRFCELCYNISDHPICQICSSVKREKSLVCVVENTGTCQGVYHVLGGLISPMDGIGPSDLTIDGLVERVNLGGINEVILAISATMEGDTTIFYLYKKLKDSGIQISTIARGIAFGGELEYVDEITLGRSIATRIPYENSLAR